MDHFREIRNNLTWHNEGKFEVELVNGVITRLNFCEPGKGPDDVGKSITSTNYKFLQAVHANLGDLFNFIEEENKRLGYSYARPEALTDGPEHTEPELVPELKMRPLINYDEAEADIVTGNEALKSIG